MINIKSILSNRNIIIAMAVIFALWLLFFDRSSIINLRDADRQIAELEIERQFLQDRITADSAVINGIKDSSYLEVYARENFFMKYPDETMFIYQSNKK